MIETKACTGDVGIELRGQIQPAVIVEVGVEARAGVPSNGIDRVGRKDVRTEARAGGADIV